MTNSKVGSAVNGIRLAASLVAIVLAFLSWVSPNHYFPWPSFESQFVAALAALILAALALSKGKPTVVWPFLACVSVCLAAVPWSQHAAGLLFFSGDAWLVSGYLLGFALCQAVGSRLAEQHGLDWLVDRAARLAVAGALVSLFLALYQWFWLGYLGLYAVDLPLQQSRAYASFNQPNSFALALILGSIAAGRLYEVRNLSGATALTLIALFSVGIVLSQSRAAIVIWLMLAAWMCFSCSRGAFSRITLWRVLIAALVAASAFLVWPWLLHYRESFAGSSDARTMGGIVSTGLRPLHWAAMIDAVGRSPWFGYGWNQVSFAQYVVAPDHPATTELLGDSHNIVLDLLVHNGVIIGGAVTVVLFHWFWRQARTARAGASAFCFCAIACFGLSSMVEFPLNYLFFLLPTGILIGGLSVTSPGPAIASPRFVALGLAMALAALSAAAAVDYHRAEEDLRALRFEQQRVGNPVARTLPSEVLVLTQLAAFFEFADMKRGRDDLTASELKKMESVIMRYPNWSLLTTFAGDLARNGFPEKAASVLLRVCRTQKPEECELARTRWRVLSQEDERIGKIPFPQ